MPHWSSVGRRRRAATSSAMNALACAAMGCALPVAAIEAQPLADDGDARWSGSFALYGGDLDGDALATGEAHFAIPFGDRYQFQFDAEFGGSDGNAFGGGMARFYWRDPDVAMVGGGIAETHRNTRLYDDVLQVFGEAAYYGFDDVTVYGQAGVQVIFNRSEFFFDGDPRLSISEPDELHSPFGRIGVAYYPTDDLSLSADLNASEQGNAYAVVSGAYDMSSLWDVSDFLLLADTHLSLEQVSARIGIKVEFGVDGLTLAGRDRAARLPVRIYDQAFVLENNWQVLD